MTRLLSYINLTRIVRLKYKEYTAAAYGSSEDLQIMAGE